MCPGCAGLQTNSKSQSLETSILLACVYASQCDIPCHITTADMQQLSQLLRTETKQKSHRVLTNLAK